MYTLVVLLAIGCNSYDLSFPSFPLPLEKQCVPTQSILPLFMWVYQHTVVSVQNKVLN